MMMMESFIKYFPESDLKSEQLFQISRQNENPVLFKLFEFYCPDTDCDCQKVLINFVEVTDQKSFVHATVSYGWESVPFYEEWGARKKEALQIKRGYLEPSSPQLEYARDLLDAFRLRVQDPEFLQMLKFHYTMFKFETSQKDDNQEKFDSFWQNI